MSNPDMRLVIHDALCWPDTEYSPFGNLDLDSLRLDFEKPDTERFPMLALAYEALNAPTLLPIAYNAANEEAVRFFIDNRIGFLEISRVTGYVIDRSAREPMNTGVNTIEGVIELDRKARQLAGDYIAKRNGS
jgi:1-deoxy-D-xylulose-5-phosphate reductoisomerase